MNLSFEPIVVERSQEFSEAQFTIGDMGIVLEILRSKLYSNAIQAFVREIGCNAKDANKEAGRENIPVKIKLPTKASPTCDFIDCGVGINQSRMYDVFINYGKSTKRKDKDAIGEFGIGAKTPFAYTNAFTIITTAAEPDGKVYRSTYSSYIDESRCGKLALISRDEVHGDATTGTTISIPILPDDFSSVKSLVEKNLRFWAVPPILIDDGKEYQLEGANKTLAPYKGLKADFYILSGASNATVLAGEMQYPLRIEELSGGFNSIPAEKFKITEWQFTALNAMLNSGIILAYPNKGVAVAANREQLDYTNYTTQTIVNDMLHYMNQYFENIGQDFKKHCNSLNEAYQFVIDARNASGHLFEAYCKKTEDSPFVYKHLDLLKVLKSAGKISLADFIAPDDIEAFKECFEDNKENVKVISAKGLLVNVKLKTFFKSIETLSGFKSRVTQQIPLTEQIILLDRTANRNKYLRKIEHYIATTGKYSVVIVDAGGMYSFGDKLLAKLFSSPIAKEFGVLTIDDLPDPPARPKLVKEKSRANKRNLAATTIFGYSFRQADLPDEGEVIYALRSGSQCTFNISKDLKKKRLEDISVDIGIEPAKLYLHGLKELLGQKSMMPYFLTKTSIHHIQETGDERFLTWSEYITREFRNNARTRRRIMRFMISSVFKLAAVYFDNNHADFLKHMYSADGKNKKLLGNFWLLLQMWESAEAELDKSAYGYYKNNFKASKIYMDRAEFVSDKKARRATVPFIFGIRHHQFNSNDIARMRDKSEFLTLLMNLLKNEPEIKALKKVYKIAKERDKWTPELLAKIPVFFNGKAVSRYYKIDMKKIARFTKKNKLKIASHFAVSHARNYSGGFTRKEPVITYQLIDFFEKLEG
jgi:hypothetical protein